VQYKQTARAVGGLNKNVKQHEILSAINVLNSGSGSLVVV
jgi:hypothetical protein